MWFTCTLGTKGSQGGRSDSVQRKNRFHRFFLWLADPSPGERHFVICGFLHFCGFCEEEEIEELRELDPLLVLVPIDPLGLWLD